MKRIYRQEYVEVNSRHHQVVCDPGSDLKIEAMAPDGFIEAIRHKRLPILGVQWHPEDLIEDLPHRRFFECFKRGFPL
jgi:gamma-glutamyl-gamma-aminobutyrate hydrolase PuuD